MRKPFDITACASFVVIIRCGWTRGREQEEAVRELEARRLWLNEDQMRFAGLVNTQGCS